jgi:hypothetical protein
MKARMYDPVIAMFQSVDPLGGAYTYVNNNPLRYTDPSGLDGWDEWEDDYDGGRDDIDYPDGPPGGIEHCWSWEVIQDEMDWFESFCLFELYPITDVQIENTYESDNLQIDYIESTFDFPVDIPETHDTSGWSDRDHEGDNLDEQGGEDILDDFIAYSLEEQDNTRVDRRDDQANPVERSHRIEYNKANIYIENPVIGIGQALW